MKLAAFLRSFGIYLSSLASVFAGQSLTGKAADIKELTKSSKKLRPNQTGDARGWGDPVGAAPPLTAIHRYPWRQQIVTTTFWIGEKPTPNNPVPNHKSCWDPQWASNYGGTDTPSKSGRTKDFIPAGFTPRQNPFYVALPYNDKCSEGHKPEAETVIPWYHDAYRGPDASVCKGRWIAIRRGNRVCYAQWEDAGPFRTDNWQYVFGNERPKPNLNKGAGLDVSPAVRDFLGMDDTDVTDWKFVDFAEIPPGPWDRFGDNNTFVINRRASERQVAALNPPVVPADQ